MTASGVRHASMLSLPTQHKPEGSGAASVGPIDRLSAVEVAELIPTTLSWEFGTLRKRRTRLRGARTVLAWLEGHSGVGWQARWLAAGADCGIDWIDGLLAPDRSQAAHRTELLQGLAQLLVCRLVLPSYDFLFATRAQTLPRLVRTTLKPEVFSRLGHEAVAMGMQPPQVTDALATLGKLVIHTGRDVDGLDVADFVALRDWYTLRGRATSRGVLAAWDLMQRMGFLPQEATLRLSAARGQRTTAELVDFYRVRPEPVRAVLIRYLDERRPALDYASLSGLARNLAGNFWQDIHEHHPEQTTFHIPSPTVEAWKERLKTVTNRQGEVRPRKNYLNLLATVRAFYLDIQEWELEDASWAEHAAPSPVRQHDLAGMQKARKATVAQVHQRIRERLPRLSVVIDSADHHRTRQAELLSTAGQTPVGETFHFNGRDYRRTDYKSYLNNQQLRMDNTLVQDLATGEEFDVAQTEDDAFWAWSIIETLRHTGVRIEELLETTQLALFSYREPKSGEVVPLLQIVPSKSDAERVLLVTPELANVLATVISRVRAANGGTVPLVRRRDYREHVVGPPLPHLFQRRFGWRQVVISPTQVSRLLNDAIGRAGIRGSDGMPLEYTAHDFRRIFATEAVTGGLPVHITAKLLGHQDLSTVQSYVAVFQDDLIRTYRAFIDARRSHRPAEEYREPSDAEWREFQEHFELRKLELGTCGRPYGSPCKHEHACIRCPMLHVDPKQRGRLAEIASNLRDRIEEAKANGWLGEVQGLQTSLDAAIAKLATVDRNNRSRATRTTHLGLPRLRKE